MTSVTEINNLEDLTGYRLHWKNLLYRTRQPSFFQTLDWLEVYWRHFGQRQRLRVLIVKFGDQIIGVLPLCVRTEWTKVGPVRVLTYPLNDWGTFFGPIGSQATATLTAGMRHLRATHRDWDIVDLRWVNRDRVDHGRTRHAMQAAGMHGYEQATNQAATIDFHGDWRDYWQSRESHWRTNVRSSEKKLRALGDVVYVRYRPEGAARGDDDPRWDLYEACEQIAAQSWQGSTTKGNTLSHQSVSEYLRATHACAVRAGGVDLNLLIVDGQPTAFAYNYYFHGHVYGLRTGYNPASRSGAGTVLVRRMLEDSFSRQDLSLDLGPGSLAAKRNWLTSVETVYRYTYFAPLALRAQVLRLKRWFDGARTSSWE